MNHQRSATPISVGIFASIVLAAGVLLALWAAPASAGPIPPDQAGVVFSNGGRIVRVNADGSGRKVLTRKNALKGGPIKLNEFLLFDSGDLRPRVSPGGDRILFIQVGEMLGEDVALVDAKTMIRDGNGVHEILKKRGKVSYRDAGWMPDGERLIAVKWVERAARTERSIVIVKPDGTVLKTVLRLPHHPSRSPAKGRRAPLKFPSELAVSPDGTALLATIRKASANVGRLEVIEIETGRRKVIAQRSGEGAWAPDGARIVFVSTRGRNGCTRSFFSSCLPAGDLYTAAPDGSSLTRTTKTRADESSPSWSPDGKRVAFASTRIRPRSEASNEIYSMNLDGSCLTWLTNGSPASAWPVWFGSATDDSDPGSCGATERPPLTELEPEYLDLQLTKPRLWLGQEFEGRLFSEMFDLAFFSSMFYGDCSRFDPSKCRPPVVLNSFPICFMGSDYAQFLNAVSKLKVRRERSATVITDPQGRGGLVLSGGSITWPGRETELFNEPKPLSAALLSRVVKELRPVVASRPGRLPAMRVPTPALRKMLKVERVVKRTGSRKQASKKLKMKPKKVRKNLRALRVARRLGPLRRQNCNPKVIDDPWGMNSHVGASGAATSSSSPSQGSRDGLPPWLREMLGR